tara:strand:- start:38 stop:229 length:192 start_codon:yes stop_codon:yes gene_type:complete
LEEQITETYHRGQKIVEVVGNSAGKLTDCLHLLHFGEPGLQTFLLDRLDQMQKNSGSLVPAID